MPWVNAVVGKIANGISCVEWKIYVVRRAGEVRRRRDLQRADFDNRRRVFKTLRRSRELEEVVDHPLPRVLEASNDFALGLTTKRLTQIYLELVGEAFWIKERNEFGMPVGLWPLPPHWVRKTPAPSNPFFDVKFFGWEGNIPMSEVVWFVHPDPSNPYGRGVGVARSLSDELETDEYAAKHMKAFFYNRARPDVIVSGKGLRESETKRLEQDWIQKLQGFWRTFKPYFISGRSTLRLSSKTSRTSSSWSYASTCATPSCRLKACLPSSRASSRIRTAPPSTARTICSRAGRLCRAWNFSAPPSRKDSFQIMMNA
jgi:hypothetical protein